MYFRHRGTIQSRRCCIYVSTMSWERCEDLAHQFLRRTFSLISVPLSVVVSLDCLFSTAASAWATRAIAVPNSSIEALALLLLWLIFTIFQSFVLCWSIYDRELHRLLRNAKRCYVWWQHKWLWLCISCSLFYRAIKRLCSVSNKTEDAGWAPRVSQPTGSSPAETHAHARGQRHARTDQVP